MKWLGLTGGIATGKSTVAEYLRKNAVKVADADKIVHELLKSPGEVIDEIEQAFGAAVINLQGHVDRRTLGQVVFWQPDRLVQLEKILHPRVKSETAKIRQQWEKAGELFAIYDVPLLFEKNMESNFDGIICVTAPESIQRQRLKARHNLTDSEVEQRLRAQLPLAQKVQGADWVLRNESNLETLYAQVDDLLKKLKTHHAHI